MENIRIRNANFDDIPYLVQLRKKFMKEKGFLTKDINILNLEENIKNFFVKNFNEKFDIVVAEDNNNIVGLFCVNYMDLLPGLDSKMDKSAYLMFDYIIEDFRNRNIWIQLLNKSINNAKKRGFNVFELVTAKRHSSHLRRIGFLKTPFPIVKLDLKSYNNPEYNKSLESSYRIARSSDIEEIIKMRKNYLEGIFNLKEKTIVFDVEQRLSEYLKKYLGRRVDIFLEIYDGKIVSTIFYLYYEDIPVDEDQKFTIGIPSNFYTEISHLKNDSLEILFDYSTNILNSKGVKVLEMAVPKDKLKFYKKMGFKSIDYMSMYKNIE